VGFDVVGVDVLGRRGWAGATWQARMETNNQQIHCLSNVGIFQTRHMSVIPNNLFMKLSIYTSKYNIPATMLRLKRPVETAKTGLCSVLNFPKY